MLKAIIIDDEPYCCEILAAILDAECPQVQIMSVCNNGENALAAICQYAPDLIFLDVEMPRMNGFELLEKLPVINFHLIFTTSYDQYALKAIRFSALDYLLKPVDREELKKAVQKAEERMEIPIPQQLQLLLQKLKPSQPINKIALPTIDGLQMIPIDSIVFCESDDNYSRLILKNKKKILVTL
jgi:two-component system LytT family response regulator